MRFEIHDGHPYIILSRRNLLALLVKLDQPVSACTIEMDGVYIKSEHDSEHYGDRGFPPGRMTQETERRIKEI